MSKLYTVNQLATALHLSVTHTRELLRRHHLKPAGKTGRFNQYDAGVFNILKTQRVKAHGYLTAHQVETKLNIRGSVIYDWMANQLVEYTQIGKHRYFSPDQVKKVRQYQAKQLKQKAQQNYGLQKLAYEWQLSIIHTRQVLAKLNRTPKTYQKSDYDQAKIIIAQMKNQTKKGQLQNQYQNDHMPSFDQLISLIDLAKISHINYRTLHHFAQRNYFPVYRLMTGQSQKKRIYLQKNDAKKIQHEYLNYPKTPIYTAKQASQKTGLSITRIHILLKIENQPLLHILGDRNNYLNEQQFKQLLIWDQKHPKKNTHPNKINHQIVNTKKKYQPTTDLNSRGLAHKFKISHHTVFTWVRNGQVPYHYNQHDELFFTKADVKIIQQKYLNYPSDDMKYQKEVIAILNISNGKMYRLKKALHINGYQILGDNRVLYSADQIKTFKYYLNKWSDKKNENHKR